MREAHFCPLCGHPLIQQAVHGRLRPICQQCGHIVYFDPKVAVVVLIVQDERVLLVQRAIDPEMGQWALPAGFVEYDEPPASAAVREVQEETGLHVELTGVLEVFPKRDNGLANIVIAYGARILGGELQAGDDAGQVDWFTRQSVPPVAFYPSQTLIGQWVRGER